MNGIRWRLSWLWSELQAHGEAYLRNMPGELGIWLRRRWHGWPGEAALLAACRDSAAFFDEIIKGFNITNDDAQSIRLRDQLRAAIASVEPQPEKEAT